MTNNRNNTIVCWGTYDIGKPRVRILLNSLNKSPFKVIECHKNIWNNIEDKSQLKGIFPKLKILLKLIIAYPQLLLRYITLPSHKIVLIPYLGIFDIFIIMPILLFKRVPVILDFFVPLYDSIVNDRKLLSKYNPLSYLIYYTEKLALHYSKVILVDTSSHGNYISKLYKVSENKFKRVFVGAEDIFFKPCKDIKSPFSPNDFNIFFYGQFIPLQGIEKIVSAARILKEKGLHNIKFTIAGIGQTSNSIDKLIKTENIDNIKRITWIPYDELPIWINKSDLCLGIFGDSIKAKSVIPNKVFQILAANKCIITSDSPAIKELLEHTNTNLINIIEKNNATLLANKIEELYNKSKTTKLSNSSISFNKDISQTQLIKILKDLT